MTDRITPQREWQAKEEALRYESHCRNAKSHGDEPQAERWFWRWMEAETTYSLLVKERESHG